MKSIQGAAQNEHGALVIQNEQPSLDPVAHRALENPVQAGSFFHGVVAMDFGELGVVQAFLHGGIS